MGLDSVFCCHALLFCAFLFFSICYKNTKNQVKTTALPNRQKYGLTKKLQATEAEAETMNQRNQAH